MADKAPWLEEGSMQNRILMEAVARSEQSNKRPTYAPSNTYNKPQPTSVPSLLDIVQNKMAQQQPQQTFNQYTPPQPTPSNGLETLLLGTMQALMNSLDKKYLSRGTVFLVCIDRSGLVKPDVDPSQIPVILSNSPTSDIKIISFQEFESDADLKKILVGYKAAVDQFQQSNAYNPAASQYHIFIGRLVENISFNDITYEI